MTRNDMIAALIRAIGVYVLVFAIIDLLSYIFSVAGHIYTAVITTVNVGAAEAFKYYPLSWMLTAFIMLLVRFVLGFYLMGGGKWFYNKATAKE